MPLNTTRCCSARVSERVAVRIHCITIVETVLDVESCYVAASWQLQDYMTSVHPSATDQASGLHDAQGTIGSWA